MPKFQDRHLVCKDCQRDFTWTAGEQAFYEEKQLQEPKRCKHCRQAMRDRRSN